MSEKRPPKLSATGGVALSLGSGEITTRPTLRSTRRPVVARQDAGEQKAMSKQNSLESPTKNSDNKSSPQKTNSTSVTAHNVKKESVQEEPTVTTVAAAKLDAAPVLAQPQATSSISVTSSAKYQQQKQSLSSNTAIHDSIYSVTRPTNVATSVSTTSKYTSGGSFTAAALPNFKHETLQPMSAHRPAVHHLTKAYPTTALDTKHLHAKSDYRAHEKKSSKLPPMTHVELAHSGHSKAPEPSLSRIPQRRLGEKHFTNFLYNEPSVTGAVSNPNPALPSHWQYAVANTSVAVVLCLFASALAIRTSTVRGIVGTIPLDQRMVARTLPRNRSLPMCLLPRVQQHQ